MGDVNTLSHLLEEEVLRTILHVAYKSGIALICYIWCGFEIRITHATLLQVFRFFRVHIKCFDMESVGVVTVFATARVFVGFIDKVVVDLVHASIESVPGFNGIDPSAQIVSFLLVTTRLFSHSPINNGVLNELRPYEQQDDNNQVDKRFPFGWDPFMTTKSF